MDILNEMLMLIVVVVGSTVAVAAFLKLAMFSRNDISFIGSFWIVGGMLCALIYLTLSIRLSISSSLTLFLIALLAGIPLLLTLSAMEPSNKRIRGWIPYAVWVYIWAAALIGWRAQWLGLLIVTLPALLIAGLGFFFIAGFILPFPEQEQDRKKRAARGPVNMPTFAEEIKGFFALFRSENKETRKQLIEQRRQALRCLLTYTIGTNYPYYVVIDEKINERADEVRTWLTDEEKLIKRVEGDSFGAFFSGPGIILTGCDQAVVLSSGTKFKGPREPGIVFTHMSDTPAHVVDLRVQLRALQVQALTKDGIEVKFVTFLPFQIGTGNEKPALGKGFPYRSSDVFKALHARLVEHTDLSQTPENLKQHEWYDLPQVAGERIMRDIISHYTFDELYAPFELHTGAGQDPRSKIVAELCARLDEILPEWGIQRIGGGIGNIEPVDERVLKQRIESWQADWARKITLQQATGQSKRIRFVEQARAQAQIDIVLAIGKQLEHLRAVNAPVRLDTVAHYFIDVLEELTGRPSLRRYLPADTSDIIRSARGATEQETADVEGE